MKPLDSNVQFKDTTDRRSFMDATYFTGSQETALQITRGGTLNTLHGQYPDVMGSMIEPSIYGQAITNLIDSSNVFVKVEKEDDGEFYTSIVSRDQTTNHETVIFQDLINPIPEEMYDETYRKVKRVPQLYISGMLDGVVQQAQIDPENPSDAMIAILDQYGR
jgi:hypothetical protein